MPRSVSDVTGREPSPSMSPTQTFRTSSTGARWASRRPSGATSGEPLSGFPKRILRGISSAMRGTVPGAPFDGGHTLRRMDARPIGMFDSGVGGLTVLHECLVTLPHEDFVYFGDSPPDRFPYGPKAAAVIARFAHEVAAHLAALDVKLIVVACNAATASALPGLQREFSVPLIGVITPEAHAAVQATRTRRVGVMATEATVASGRYPQAVHLLDAGIEVAQVACPLLVPLLQSGDVHGAELHDAPRSYAAGLKDADVDRVILGCTHYPLIRPMLQRFF